MQLVKIHRGIFSNGVEVENLEVGLVEDLQNDAYPPVKGYNLTGLFDTTQTTLPRKRAKHRIFFRSDADLEITSKQIEISAPGVASKDSRSDEEILSEIRNKFHMLSLLSQAAAKGQIRSMIVTGSAGTGKSWTVQQAIRAQEREHPGFCCQTIKGSITPVMLYIALFETHSKGNVLILDDADMVFEDVETLNLLKAATESQKRRSVSYKKMNMALEAAGIPTQFDYEGTIIILSNIDLEDARNKKLSPHFEAIISRAHFISTVFKSAREKLLRIISVIEDENLLDEYIPKSEHKKIVDFIKTNENKFKELSLRTVVKLAELYSSFGKNWENMARATILR